MYSKIFPFVGHFCIISGHLHKLCSRMKWKFKQLIHFVFFFLTQVQDVWTEANVVIGGHQGRQRLPGHSHQLRTNRQLSGRNCVAVGTSHRRNDRIQTPEIFITRILVFTRSAPEGDLAVCFEGSRQTLRNRPIRKVAVW